MTGGRIITSFRASRLRNSAADRKPEQVAFGIHSTEQMPVNITSLVYLRAFAVVTIKVAHYRTGKPIKCLA